MFIYVLFCILMAIACYAVGVSKGYSAGVCIAAGFFGNLIALLVLLLLPDQLQEEANAAHALDYRDREIAALQKRVTQLEEALRSQTAAPPSDSAKPAAKPETGTPAQALFPARTREVVACPVCGTRQRGDRDLCYACQTPFRYEQE